jgi:hypothetical protein
VTDAESCATSSQAVDVSFAALDCSVIAFAACAACLRASSMAFATSAAPRACSFRPEMVRFVADATS